MSATENGQGAELRPSPPRYRQTSLLQGNILRPDGYLFQKKINEDLAQAHLLGRSVKARRDGAMADYVAPEKYIRLSDAKLTKQLDKEANVSPEDLLTVGHNADFNDSWPRMAKSDRFRVLHANVHGFHPANNNMELDFFIQQAAQLQVDMPTAVEVNQPLENPTVRNDIRGTIRRFDKHAKVNFGNSDVPSNNRGWQMGGTLSFVQGGAAGLVNDMGSDECGRWSWTNLGSSKLCMINAYRVGPGNDGIKTARSMEMRRLMAKGHALAKSPQKAFDADLAEMVINQAKNGCPVILLMDANSPPDSIAMKKFMRKTGLKNLFRVLHPTLPFPRTYDRGDTCIDFPLVSDDAIPLIKAMGYLPFYTLGPDDHRSFFIDLYYDKLRSKMCTENRTRATRATPSLRRPVEMQRFIDKYKTLLEKADLFEKVEKLKKRFEVASRTERQYLQARLDKYDAVWVELAQAAVKSASSKYSGNRDWSPTFARHGIICRYWNHRLRKFYTDGTLNPTDMQIPPKYTPPRVQSEAELVKYHSEAVQDWHTTKGNAAALRVQHLEDLIEYYMAQRNVKRETAVKQLLHWEEVRNLHVRHSAIMTRTKPNVIKSLIIPKPHSQDPNALMEITNPDHIQQIILRRNATKLGAAHGTHFTVDPLAKLVGQHGDTKSADDLLNGTFNIDDYLNQQPQIKYQEELKLFLQHMQRPKNEDGTRIPDMKWEFGPEEFRDTFSKKREDTACGPSGITMQFYRIFCLDDDLAKLHATFIYLPFRYGFSLKRWQQSVHFMLMKIDVPLWEKLRIIQLLEGDFNGGLRYIFGRKLMKFSVKSKTSSDSTYGGRPGRSCHDALLRIQLSMEFCRIQRLMAAFMDIDATACFDNQIRNLIGIMTKRLGADTNIARCQTETLEQMEHSVRIQQGVSTESIRHSKDKPLYGSGQGSGAGVVNWHGHNETLIAMYDDKQPGCRMQSPDKLIELIQRVISFVDDNKLMRSFPATTQLIDAMKMCSASINFWSKSLQVTGGKLDPNKSKMQFLTYDFDTYSYGKHYPYRGEPVMKPIAEQMGECVLHGNTANDTSPLEKIEPHRGRKLLGVRLAADGNCGDEFQARKQQSEKMALRLERSHASPVDAYMIYVFRYCPAVFYCLPLTYFTREQCTQIQAPFVNALLPKLRMNRHIKRDIVWGPRKYGGLNLAHMETEQIARTTESLIGHVRAETPTGVTFVITCGAYQMFLGIETPFFFTAPEAYPHRLNKRSSKLTYLWETLHTYRSTIYIRKQWRPSHKDTPCIMDAVIAERTKCKGTTKCIRDETVRLVNTCRLWLRAIYVEDICLESGEADTELLNGEKQCATDLNFPHQPKPPGWVWKIWKQTIIQSCFIRDESNKLRLYNKNPPTSWMPPSMSLPATIQPILTLKQIVLSLPEPYQMILGTIEYPDDDGEALARSIETDNASLFSDGTVETGCGAHAYTLRTPCDNPAKAIKGAAPTSGDPETISSLRTEHFGALAGIVWTWILVKKFGIQRGGVNGAIDNLTVVNRLNTGIDDHENHKQHLSTDIDVWRETEKILAELPTTFSFRHVKGHQDNMHKLGIQGPLTRDAFWNVQMDRDAEAARLTDPMETEAVFGSSPATFYHDGKPVHTKIGRKIRSIRLDQPLRQYIQQKEQWDDETFETVDWKAFDASMNKLSIHKRINIAKYVFNWQNTGRQKQLFEDAQAMTEERDSSNVVLCPMGCGQPELPQHYLQCPILHNARVITRDLAAVTKWMEKNNTLTEMRIIIGKSLLHWMQYGTNIEFWELEDTPYKADLEDAIQAQNFIGWDNMMKGRLAQNWGDIQMRYYEEFYDDIPKYISATWWASELIRQLLFFSLSTWQHRNNHLHEKTEAERRIQEREDAIESMAQWYDRAHEFPSDDKPNFARSFLERCTDTTAQIRLWLGKIVDIHKYNKRTTIRGYFSLTE